MKDFIEKLISRLEEQRGHICNCMPCNGCKYIGDCNEGEFAEDVALDKAIEIVNQLAEEYKGGWISVKDRLPEPIDGMLQCVIVTDKNDWQGMAYYHPQKGWVFAECHNSDTKIDWTEVIAWQPLPPKYESKGK